jgi:hypothetical protein
MEPKSPFTYFEYFAFNFRLCAYAPLSLSAILCSKFDNGRN